MNSLFEVAVPILPLTEPTTENCPTPEPPGTVQVIVKFSVRVAEETTGVLHVPLPTLPPPAAGTVELGSTKVVWFIVSSSVREGGFNPRQPRRQRAGGVALHDNVHFIKTFSDCNLRAIGDRAEIFDLGIKQLTVAPLGGQGQHRARRDNRVDLPATVVFGRKADIHQ